MLLILAFLFLVSLVVLLIYSMTHRGKLGKPIDGLGWYVFGFFFFGGLIGVLIVYLIRRFILSGEVVNGRVSEAEPVKALPKSSRDGETWDAQSVLDSVNDEWS